MAAPTPPLCSDDDLLPDLPAVEGDETGLEVDLADEIDELGLEETGIDAATGPEDLPAMVDLESLGDEDELSEAYDSSEQPLEEDTDLAVGEELCWTEGSEPPESVPWETDIEGDEDGAAIDDDTGDEGVDERFDGFPEDGDGSERSVEQLASEEEVTFDPDLDRESEIDPAFQDALTHPALALPRLGPTQVEVAWFGPEGDAIRSLGAGLACGRRLYRLEGGRAIPVELEGLEGDESTSVARTASGAWIIGLLRGGVVRCRDGRRLERLNGARPDAAGPVQVLEEPYATGVRVWARTGGGMLLRSEDEGASWSVAALEGPVIALAGAEDGGVVVVIRARSGALWIARTRDGGRSWHRVAGPRLGPLPEGCAIGVAARGPHLALSSDAPGSCAHVSCDDGGRWEPIESMRGAGPLAIVEERGVDVLYAGVFVEDLRRGLVVRAPLPFRGEARLVVDLDEVAISVRLAGTGAPKAQRILAIAATGAAERTCLSIAGELGIVRAQVQKEADGA